MTAETASNDVIDFWSDLLLKVACGHASSLIRYEIHDMFYHTRSRYTAFSHLLLTKLKLMIYLVGEQAISESSINTQQTQSGKIRCE